MTGLYTTYCCVHVSDGERYRSEFQPKGSLLQMVDHIGNQRCASFCLYLVFPYESETSLVIDYRKGIHGLSYTDFE